MDGQDANAYIGRYRCISYLGSGGMADVFKCELQGIGGFGRLCVVKRMKNELAHDEEHVAMFLDEARLVARIQHPNVVQVFEVDAVDNIPFIAMELVRGPTLSQLTRAARKRGDIRVDMVVRVIADVALGLAAAHGVTDDSGAPLNIVHRDVSPQNIMIGLGGTAKILDFGIAKAEGKLGKTATGLLKGKVAYMSPEQINIKDVDARADIYSLGVCLYQAIIGHLPFRGTNDFEVLRARMGGDFTPASVVRPDLPPVLTSLIDRALADDPAERFTSALEFHEELETWLLDEGAADRRTLSAWVSELFPDIDALVAGRPVAGMGMISTVPTTQTLTPTSHSSVSRSSLLSSPGAPSPGLTSSPGVSSPGMMSSSEASSPGIPLSVIAPESTRETVAAVAPKRFTPVVVGGFAALAAGLGVYVAMQRPAPPVVVVPPVPVAVAPTPVPVAPVAPIAPVAPAVVEPPPVVDDEAALGSLDEIAAAAKPAVAGKPKPKPWAPPSSATPSSATPTSGVTSPVTASPDVTAPPAASNVATPAEVVATSTPPPSTPTTTPSLSASPSQPLTVSAPAPPVSAPVLPPEAPQLPKQKRVLQVKELVAACADIEAELERRGHLPASRVRNVTAPLARALAGKLVDGDAIELPMTSIYWFVARRLAGQAGQATSRNAVATALVDAYRSNSLGR